MDGIGCLEAVPSAKFGSPFNDSGTDFNHDQLDPRKEDIELGKCNKVARPKRL